MVEARFRVRKRQKVYRKRLDEDDDDEGSYRNDNIHDGAEMALSIPVTADGDAVCVTDIVRRTRRQKSKCLGVGFSSFGGSKVTGGGGGGGGGDGGGNGGCDASTSVFGGHDAPEQQRQVEVLPVKQFAPQTGLVSESLDRHMMAYVDSKMAELRNGGSHTADVAAMRDDPTATRRTRNFAASVTSAYPSNFLRPRQPTGMGRLMEIDLGPEAARKNIERTEEATRRLQSGELPAQEVQVKGRRGRKRKTSEEIKRDRLVEEILNESRLEMYDDRTQPEQQQQKAADDETAADDRIIDQFRRDFYEALQSRIRRPPANHNKGKGKTKAADDKPRGPKLGGSRSARAAMRAEQEKQKKKK